MSLVNFSTIQSKISVMPTFKDWVIKPIGRPILQESDWNLAAFPNGKWGALLDGTSTLTKETTNFLWGGAASIKMLTDATTLHTSEIKTGFFPNLYPNSLLAFEQKWVEEFTQTNTVFHVGLESRDTHIRQARFQYDRASLEWKYENGISTYASFPSSIGDKLLVTRPIVDAATGSLAAWTRVIIDPISKLYVGFQASGINGIIETRDMRTLGLSLIDRGAAASGSNIFLPFALVQTLTNNAQDAYTTDWCISIIPQGVNPF